MSSSHKNSKASRPALGSVLEAGQTSTAGETGSGLERQQNNAAWDQAEARLLLYLRALRIPAPQRLQLALEALQRAAADRSSGQRQPAVTRAMQVLRALIGEQKLSASQNTALQFQGRREQVRSTQPEPQDFPAAAHDAAAAQNRPVATGTLVVAPPVKRSAMVPGHMDRKPWLSLLSGRFRGSGRER